METLLLTDKEVRMLLDMRDVINAVEVAFREKGLGRVQMPPKVYLFYGRHEGDLRVMPSYIEEAELSAVKIVNSHPNNRERYGLPTVMATVVLVDPSNGFPLAIMGGSWLTAMRTGAAGGIAAKYLARKDSESVCFIGAGMQARTQLMALSIVLDNLRKVSVYDLNNMASCNFADYVRNLLGGNVSVEVHDSPRKSVEGADVIVTTTPSRKPIIMDEWISSGVHFNCIGADAPGKEEISPAILLRAKVVVDDIEQAIHCGELNVPVQKGVFDPSKIHGELGEIVAGLKKGRESDEEITIFTSTGIAIQDAAAAKIAYEKALANNIGMKINFVT